MTKIKAIEIYRKIFEVLDYGGIFMLSLWTTHYFEMPIGPHGKEGFRPNHIFTRIPMTEDLRILSGVPGRRPEEIRRLGEIRRFYRDYEELLEEFKSADEKGLMDIENIRHKYDENKAILRVWIQKK